MSKPPQAPKKSPPKKILPFSRFYPEINENNNLSAENLNAKPVNLNELVKAVKANPGNKPLPFTHKNLNYVGVPKLQLPPHLQGGKRKTQRRRYKKHKYTRKH